MLLTHLVYFLSFPRITYISKRTGSIDWKKIVGIHYWNARYALSCWDVIASKTFLVAEHRAVSMSTSMLVLCGT